MQTTRRKLLAGAVALTAFAAAGILPAAPCHAASLEAHWQARRRAYAEFDADPDSLDDPEVGQRYWDRIDAAESAILNSPDTSTRAAELRLWVAWSHCDATRREAVAQGDVTALLRERAKLDWQEKLIFAAILNLRGEG
ncbi:hypothetical protein [Sphingomonas aracearum]|uniref:Uncharacterized protein n=1 Tax=Sphingomonas aracearum TaxID=2283317 RepID=A0A369VVH8_9SPHN|nr:hypothetical protein [Sphingomonas aracearum]RDE05577.1 hypothetical protein DVW87_10110 [Sphingomonas aracearum]